MGATDLGSSLPAIQGGMARAVAITGSPNRWPALPDVPTAAEAGYPTVTAGAPHGNSGPPNMPSYIVDIWEKVLEEMAKDPEIISKLRTNGAIPFYLNANATAKYFMREMEEVERLWGLK